MEKNHFDTLLWSDCAESMSKQMKLTHTNFKKRTGKK